MQRKKNRIMITVVVLMAFVGLITGLFVSQYMHQRTSDMTQFHGTWLKKPRDVSSFNLMGSNQLPFNNASLQHQWTMMFFGFTSCPSICPVTMTELGKMYRLLEDHGVTPLPQVVLISLDPERDSVETLNQYVTAFNPHFMGARAESEDVVKAMAKEVGVAYTKIASADGNVQNYNIEHTGTVMLFNPEGKLCAFFTMPHRAKLLAQDYVLALSSVS